MPIRYSMKRSAKVALLFSLMAVLVVTMQNCSRFDSETSGVTSLSTELDSFRAYDPLQCPKVPNATQKTAVKTSAIIRAIGRMSRYDPIAGFIDKNDEVYVADTTETTSVFNRHDPGVKYKWVDFGHDICGVTVTNQVRCSFGFMSNKFTDYPSLAGSEQVAIVGTSICGLDAQGNAQCVATKDPAGPSVPVRNPRPIKLITREYFVESENVAYSSTFAKVGDFSNPIMGKNDLTAAANPRYSDYLKFNTCNHPIVAMSIQRIGNEFRGAGCLVSQFGVLSCVVMRDDGTERMKMRTVLPDGSLTREFQSVDPIHNYVSVMSYQNYGCAMRDDDEVMCFSLGFVPNRSPLVAFSGRSERAGLGITFPNPETITDGRLIGKSKACVLQSGKGLCWFRSLLDAKGSVISAYEIKTDMPLQKIVGDIRGATSAGAESLKNDRACFLTTGGELICESYERVPLEPGRVIRMDPGVSYLNFFIEGSSGYFPCGLTTDRRVRCLYENPFVKEPQDMRTYFSDVVYFAPGTVIDSAGRISNQLPAFDFNKPEFSPLKSAPFSRVVRDLPFLFVGTDGATYETTRSSNPIVQVNSDSLSRILAMKPGPVRTYYFDPSLNSCGALMSGVLVDTACPHHPFVVGESIAFLSTEGLVSVSKVGIVTYLDDGGKSVSLYIPPQPIRL